MPVKNSPQQYIVCPNLILMRGSKVLLLRRANWAPLHPGHWHCVTGKIESGETPLKTIIREAKEEVALDVDPFLGTTISVSAPSFENPEQIWRDISLFFVCKDFEGEPLNMEPRLHDAMEWFDIRALPDPIIPVVRYGINHYIEGKSYGEFDGFKTYFSKP